MTSLKPPEDPPPCWPEYQHVVMRESDGVPVCQVCGEVMS